MAKRARKMVFTFDNFSSFSSQATKDLGIALSLPILATPGRVC